MYSDTRDILLDERLANDCLVIGDLEFCRLLLMNNAGVPWFILVPATSEREICDLGGAEREKLWAEVNTVGEFVRTNFEIDKLNIGAIGNIVAQLHVHVIGRRRDDYCWPEPVWGQEVPGRYSAEAFAKIEELAHTRLELRNA